MQTSFPVQMTPSVLRWAQRPSDCTTRIASEDSVLSRPATFGWTGLYFDQQGAMIDNLVTDTRIRVGMSALNFPWPAPNGIADYTLRELKDTPELTSIVYLLRLQ